MRRASTPTRRRMAIAAGLVAGTITVAGVSGCETSDDGADLVAGKQAFVAKCGSCHILNRAGSRGTQGPNLDQAFQQALKDGFKRDTILGMVEKQIVYPARNGVMPAKLFTNDDDDCSAADKKKYNGRCATAHDVAAYVASVVSKTGKDEGLLASAVGGSQKALARAQNGILNIPADPGGQLLYIFKNAEAPAGPLTINSPNESATPHNIAVEGQGSPGAVVQDGGNSTVKVELTAGQYEFLCTVPGHAAAGMKGTLTVK